MSERIFRVSDRVGYHDEGIPWRVIQPHARQAMRNHGQSLERLHERGGLSWCEAAAILQDREWRPMDKAEAKALVLALVAKSEAEAAPKGVSEAVMDDAARRLGAPDAAAFLLLASPALLCAFKLICELIAKHEPTEGRP